ncbi:MAG: hypothetical protein AAGA03_00745, partial [Planctomycetota bacterium]
MPSTFSCVRRCPFRSTAKLSAALSICLLLGLVSHSSGQDRRAPGSGAQARDPEAERERMIADRFLQVVLRRPAPGTALNRVYAHHIQAGTLDDLMAELRTNTQGKGDQAGASQMTLGLLQLRRGDDAKAAESLATAEQMRSDDPMASYHLGR